MRIADITDGDDAPSTDACVSDSPVTSIRSKRSRSVTGASTPTSAAAGSSATSATHGTATPRSRGRVHAVLADFALDDDTARTTPKTSSASKRARGPSSAARTPLGTSDANTPRGRTPGTGKAALADVASPLGRTRRTILGDSR